MPGNFVFKPIEAHFHNDNINPYLRFNLGSNKAKTHECIDKGSNPHWNECFTLNRTHEEFCEVLVKDKANPSHKELGAIKVPLADIEKNGKMCKWFDIGETGKPVGQLLLEVNFESSSNPGQEGSTKQSGQQSVNKDKPMKSGQDVFTQNPTYQSGQQNVNKNKPMMSGQDVFTQDATYQSGQQNVNKNKPMMSGQDVFTQNPTYQSGQQNVNRDRPMKSGENVYGQDPTWQAGQQGVDKNKAIPMKYGEEKIGQGQEGISQVNKTTGKQKETDYTQKNRYE